ncbi:hypothetical protein OF83DRAFT_1127987 [Amylostereum chailletii]|nr:hypothetical protein OF83DRAFT_1127987 [Amylostereum chailletii]
MHRIGRISRLVTSQKSIETLCQRRSFSFSSGLVEELENRGFVSQVTRPALLNSLLASGVPQTVYAGVDLTARSLHVGHILPLLCLLHFQVRGHNVIPLIGGATALIGDPSGRSTERPHMARARVEENVALLTANIDRFFKRASEYAESRLEPDGHSCRPATVRNNIEWFDTMGMLEFLRDVGTNARVNSMLARESVQSRLNSNQGISFAEFTYQLLQAYDFLSLHKQAGCTIQVGGSDQWGNIVAGIELINRANDPSSAGSGESEGEVSVQKGFGITVPLLTTSTGEKFGKSAGNAVWLDEKLTSVLDFYQFFLRTTDADVEKYLKLFTLLPLSRIGHVMEEHKKQPDARAAQRLLAQEVTTLVHTAEGLRHAQAATRVLFGIDVHDVKATDVVAALTGDPRLHLVDPNSVFNNTAARLAVQCKLVKSNSAARSLVAMGGLYVNGKPTTLEYKLQKSDLIDDRLLILRTGKANHAVVALWS